MAIRDARLQRARGNPYLERLIRKENMEWELAGYARQDGDHAAEAAHTEMAREYSRQARELE